MAFCYFDSLRSILSAIPKHRKDQHKIRSSLDLRYVSPMVAASSISLFGISPPKFSFWEALSQIKLLALHWWILAEHGRSLEPGLRKNPRLRGRMILQNLEQVIA